MPAKIEQIGNRSMCTQESLGLLHGFEGSTSLTGDTGIH
jgi:hypothetical protein